MPTAQSALPPYAETTTGTAGGGGGGGLTAESDPLLWYDEGANVYYLKVAEFDDTGAFTGYALIDDAGATYVPVGPTRPAAGGLTQVGVGAVTPTRVNNTTHNSAAGNLATHYIVIADAVTVDGVAVPANTGHTFDMRPDALVPAIAFVADATGDVLVIEEAA